MAGQGDDGAIEAQSRELREFYDGYIDAFNRGDRAAFAACFHLPATIVHAPRYDDRRAGRPLVVVTETAQLWPPLPSHWTRTTIDDVRPVSDLAAFTPRDGLDERGGRRPAILATVTRWATDGAPYEQLHVLYVLTREGGHLGIKSMVELAVADREV